MRKVTFATIATAGLATATLGLASPVLAAPSEVAAVQDTVNSLRAQGYTVIMNKVGNGPLSQCRVSAVRPGQTYSRSDSGVPGAMMDYTTTIVGRTVYVEVTC